MISVLHPYWHVRAVLDRHGGVMAVPVSYYTYKPRTVEDKRTTWEIAISDFLNAEYMAHVMEKTPRGQELAIHSNIRINGGQDVHLVMIDMSTSARAHLEKLRAFLGDNFYQQISWYSSGRSFHGYGTELLSRENWYRFMGLLLLANQPHLGPTVDPRWIGHRLLAGYAALRWTKNTSQYLGVPSKLDADERRSRL